MNQFVKRRRRLRRCSVLAAVLLASCTLIAQAGDDDDDDDAGARGTLVEVVDGRTRVQLDSDALGRFGIAVSAAAIEHHVAEQLEFGETLDSAAILAARNTFEASRAAYAAAAAMVDGQRALIERITAMREQGLAIDTIALAREQRQLTDFVAVQRRARFALASARQTAVLQWGAEFGARIVAQDDPVFDALLAGERHIISVPVRRPTAVKSPVFVGRSGVRADAVAGTWIGPDARSRTPLGTSYLVAAADPGLRSGMRVSIWVSNPDAAFDVLRVPRRALIWHAGSRWIYAELGPGVFERRRVQVAATDADAMLIEAGAQAMPRVVVTGATSLLGEEFRWSIPDEDDD
jgi:hypothetical protein